MTECPLIKAFYSTIVQLHYNHDQGTGLNDEDSHYMELGWWNFRRLTHQKDLLHCPLRTIRAYQGYRKMEFV